MIRREFPSSEYHELVTGLCERLAVPGLDPVAKEEVLQQLENVLTQRMNYIKARTAENTLTQSLFPRPFRARPVERGA